MDKDTKILKIENEINKRMSRKLLNTYDLIEFIIDELEKIEETSK